MKKLAGFVDLFPAVASNINVVGREPITISKDKAICRLKNGSKIESFSTASIVGERVKAIANDESWRIQEQVLKQNVLPCGNYTREVCIQNGYEDFEMCSFRRTFPVSSDRVGLLVQFGHKAGQGAGKAPDASL